MSVKVLKGNELFDIRVIDRIWDGADTSAFSVDATGKVKVNGNLIGSTGSLATGAVTTAKLANGAVTFAKMSAFLSTEQTGTGASQNIAHGLSGTPSKVIVVPSDLSPATVGQYTMTQGTHTSTNVVVTVTTGKKFYVLAFL